MTKLIAGLAGASALVVAGVVVMLETADVASAMARGFSRPAPAARSFSRPAASRSFSRPAASRSFSRPAASHSTRTVSRSSSHVSMSHRSASRTVSRTRTTHTASTLSPTKHVFTGRHVPHGPIPHVTHGPYVNVVTPTSRGPHVNVVTPGDLKSGPGKITTGPGKTATGPGKIATGPGKIKTGPGKITTGPGKVGPGKVATGPGPTAGPGPGAIGPGRITVINNVNVTIFRGTRTIFWAGRLRTLLAAELLAGVYLSGTYYEPDGYVALAEPVCRGATAEGCALSWRNVPTQDGDSMAQCVQFCQRTPAGRTRLATAAAADPAAAATPPGPAAMAQGCEVMIYSDPSFAGTSADVTSDQPQLGADGWDKEIASLEVKAGTWDFYAEDNYGGQTIRLPPGRYGTLEAWSKQISSFMCAQTPK
jgi:hypothetical protein